MAQFSGAMAASFQALLRYIEAEEATLKALQLESLKACLVTGKKSKTRPGDALRAKYYKLYCTLQLQGLSTAQQKEMEEWEEKICVPAFLRVPWSSVTLNRFWGYSCCNGVVF